MSTVNCPHCAAENARENEYCDSCGKKLHVNGGLICPQCLTVNFSSQTTCRECGATLEGATELDLPSGEAEEDRQAILDTWLAELPEVLDTDELGKAKAQSQKDEIVPEWLDELQEHKSEAEGDSTILDWLTRLEPDDTDEPGEPAAAVPTAPKEDIPDWVAELTPREEWPETEEDEILAQTLAELEDDAEEPIDPEMAQTKPLRHSRELNGVPEQLVRSSLPEWMDEKEEANEDLAGEKAEEVTSDTEAKPNEKVIERPELIPPAYRQSEIEAADETVGEEELPDWLEAPEGMDLDEALDEMLVSEQPAAIAGEVETWPDLIDQLSLVEEETVLSKEEEVSLPTEEESLFTLDIEPGDAEIPGWLEVGPPKVSEDTAPALKEEHLETFGPLAGLRGVIQVAPEIAEPKEIKRGEEVPLTNEERRLISLLRGLTEPREEPAKEDRPVSEAGYATQRILLGLILLALILVGWFLPDLADVLPGITPSATSGPVEALHEVVQTAPSGTALVAFEYGPLYAGELDGVAGVLLQDLAQQGRHVVTVSQFATGVALAERAVADVEGLESIALGYLPGDDTGLRRLGGCLAGDSSCKSLFGRTLEDDLAARLSEVSMIVILTGDRDNLVNWIEQVGTRSDAPLLTGVTQSLVPVTIPYLASEQLDGSVSGITSAAAYEDLINTSEKTAGELMQVVTLAQWLAIIALIGGALYFGLTGLVGRQIKRGQVR